MGGFLGNSARRTAGIQIGNKSHKQLPVGNSNESEYSHKFSMVTVYGDFPAIDRVKGHELWAVSVGACR